MKKFLLIIPIMLGLSCQTKNDSQEQQLINDSLSSQFQTIYERGNIHGFSVSLVNSKQTIYQQSFGFANVKEEKKYSHLTRQRMASVSKTIVGISLLKAQELGKLHLGDPINKYLPFAVTNPFYPDEEITIRHLANHTSTILDTDLYDESSYFLKNDDYLNSPYPIEMPYYFNSPQEPISILAFMKNMIYTEEETCCREVFLNEKPGTTYKYSNGGTTLAAAILELATDMSFIDFSAKYVFEPLAMKSTSWNTDDINTMMYHNADSVYADYYSLGFPAGGLVTNAEDMSKFLSELISGNSGDGIILLEESYNEFFNKAFADEFSKEPFPDDENLFMNINYNKGVFMGIAPKGYIGHTGADPGTVTFMFFNHVTNMGFLYITNRLIWTQFEDALEDLWEIIAILEKQTS